MHAIFQERYGTPDTLNLEVVNKPVISSNEVLIRVHAASVNQADCYFMAGTPYIMRAAGAGMGFGFRGPRLAVRGRDLAGVVEAAGSEVTRFQPGDEVYGELESGSFAEYTSAPESLLALKPRNLTFEQAAAVPLAGMTALQGLRDAGQVQPGQKVLIVGASGGVGTFAVQIAKAFGAEVTGVCSTRNMERVRSLGADHVIDYTREDFTRGNQKYDLIFQVAGTQSPSRCRHALTPTGTLVLSSGQGSRWFGPLGRILIAMGMSPFISQRIHVLAASASSDDLATLRHLIEAGKVMPAIEKTFTLEQVPEAMRCVSEGHAQAKVVISV